MTGAAPRKFDFDTVFDDGGGVYQPPRAKRSFTPEEVEAVRAAAYAEGQGAAVAVAEAAVARALQEVAATASSALSTLTGLAHDHRTASAELALACARKIAGAALDHAPEAPAAAALQALAQELEAMPRLVVHVAPQDEARVAAALAEVAARVGLTGSIVVKPEAGRARAAFILDWGEGRAAFDPAAAADRVAKALETALAIEGMHAEVVVPSIGP
jgi:flagellar assembly protein FliH